MKENVVTSRNWVLLLSTVLLTAAMFVTVVDMIVRTARDGHVPLSDVGIILGLLSFSFTSVVMTWPKGDKH